MLTFLWWRKTCQICIYRRPSKGQWNFWKEFLSIHRYGQILTDDPAQLSSILNVYTHQPKCIEQLAFSSILQGLSQQKLFVLIGRIVSPTFWGHLRRSRQISWLWRTLREIQWVLLELMRGGTALINKVWWEMMNL